MKVPIEVRIMSHADTDEADEQIHVLYGETPVCIMVSSQASETGVVLMLQLNDDGTVSPKIVDARKQR